ncbi:uncharacterized protein LOC130700368 [Daphnia carinata]|uniref:uncharacterized protein LOC130700368 n=1 Tax=Daphnia carinata TaxID=120202 RepID=UPI00257B1F45|nr:uncharacterized protein LOC130700368 [Daphnia carinata]
MNKFDQVREVIASRGRGRGGGRGRGRDGRDRGGYRGGSRGNMRGNFKGGKQANQNKDDSSHKQLEEAQGNHDRESVIPRSDGQTDAARGSHGRGETAQGRHSRGGPPRGNRGRGGPSRGNLGKGNSKKGNQVRHASLEQAKQSKKGDIQKKENTKEKVGSEIKDGLSLYVTFKDGPDVYELEKLKGFHALLTPPSKKEKEKIILFKDIESLEAAKLILTAHQNVKSTNLMGFKSFKRQSNTSENCRLFLRFDKAYDEDTVKKLDSKILEVLSLKDNSCCKVQFESPEEAMAAAGRLKNLIRKTGLRQVDGFAGSTATKLGTSTTDAIIHPDQVVLRDVPKDASIKDFASLFPEAISYVLYDKTFPASKFCHAALRFKNTERVGEILKCKFLNIASKKVYVFPAYAELLCDNSQLGEPEPVEVEVKEEPPSKKRKVDVKNEQEEYTSDEEEDDGIDEDED